MKKLSDTIREPGKFEGEPRYVRNLWENSMDGMEDETIYDCDTPVSVFKLNAEDRAAFDLDSADYAVCLWEDSNGFVHSRVMSESDLDSFRSECESEVTDDASD